jgi:hypothetical protein
MIDDLNSELAFLFSFHIRITCTTCEMKSSLKAPELHNNSYESNYEQLNDTTGNAKLFAVTCARQDAFQMYV